MFDQLKQLKQLKEIQDQLKKERVEVGKNGVAVVVNGKMEIEDITLNPELGIEQQEKAVKDCVNDAVRKIQTNLAQKMSQMGNFNL
jgi:DNA-binding protein YbaB